MPATTSEDTGNTLAQVVRTELAAVWQRGVNTAPNGVNALHDKQAAASYTAIMTAVHRHVEQVTIDLWDRVHGEELAAGETDTT